MRYRRVGAFCELDWYISQGDDIYWVAGHLPEGMRPESDLFVPAAVASMQGLVMNVTAMCFVKSANGEVGMQTAVTTNGSYNRGIVRWAIKQ